MRSGNTGPVGTKPAALPPSVRPYKQTPVFTQDTVPLGLLKSHSTKHGVWGVITVLSGRLHYCVPATGETAILSPGRSGVVEPTVPHRVKPLGAVTFSIEFWR